MLRAILLTMLVSSFSYAITFGPAPQRPNPPGTCPKQLIELIEFYQAYEGQVNLEELRLDAEVFGIQLDSFYSKDVADFYEYTTAAKNFDSFFYEEALKQALKDDEYKNIYRTIHHGLSLNEAYKLAKGFSEALNHSFFEKNNAGYIKLNVLGHKGEMKLTQFRRFQKKWSSGDDNKLLFIYYLVIKSQYQEPKRPTPPKARHMRF